MDVVGTGLGHAGRDGADAPGRDQLHADPGVWVDGTKVGDELGEVLDRVDVVMRRRADVGPTGLPTPERGDIGRRLARRQLAALAGLGALGDLDLELFGASEVGGGDAEPARGDLLDRRIATLPIRTGLVPRRILATLPGVGRSSCPLDADRQNLVRLGRQGADAHGAHDQATHDVPGRFDLVDGNCAPTNGRTDLEAIANDGRLLPGDGRAIGGKARSRQCPGRARCHQFLDGCHDLRGEQVSLAVRAKPGQARVRQARLARRRRCCHARGGRPIQRSCWLEPAELARGQCLEVDRAFPAEGRREAARHDLGREIEGLEEGAADVRGNRADAHAGERLAQAALERIEQVPDRLDRRQLLRTAHPGELGRDPDGQPWMGGARAGREDHCQRMHVEDVGCIGDDVGPAPEARVGEGRVDRPDREDRRDRHALQVERSIRDDQDRGAAARRRDRLLGQSRERGRESRRASGHSPRCIELPRTSARHRTYVGEDPGQVCDHRACEADSASPARNPAEQRRAASEVHPEIHDEALAFGVDRWICDLGERLLQVIGGPTVDSRQGGRRGVVAHAPQRLVLVDDHRPEVEAQALGIEPDEEAPAVRRVRDADRVEIGRRRVDHCR